MLCHFLQFLKFLKLCRFSLVVMVITTRLNLHSDDSMWVLMSPHLVISCKVKPPFRGYWTRWRHLEYSPVLARSWRASRSRNLTHGLPFTKARPWDVSFSFFLLTDLGLWSYLFVSELLGPVCSSIYASSRVRVLKGSTKDQTYVFL